SCSISFDFIVTILHYFRNVLNGSSIFICRRVLTQHLSKFGVCDIAVDGEEALQAIEMALESESPYDLICLDIMMPELDGHETLTAIRKLESKFSLMPGEGSHIIMTTSLKDSKNVMTAFSNQCKAYLVKPINQQKIEEALKKTNLMA
ncbi:MAG: response regulator, partial [Lentisphaeria bacterium]|nr:response regulator [Lentisphaeria bacterium]